MKKYLMIGSVQLLIVMLFSLVVYFMFKIESIILNPIPYTVGLGAPVLIVDLVILIYLFKRYENKDDEIANT